MYVEQRAFRKLLLRLHAAAHGPRKFTARAACMIHRERVSWCAYTQRVSWCAYVLSPTAYGGAHTGGRELSTSQGGVGDMHRPTCAGCTNRPLGRFTVRLIK